MNAKEGAVASGVAEWMRDCNELSCRVDARQRVAVKRNATWTRDCREWDCRVNARFGAVMSGTVE